MISIGPGQMSTVFLQQLIISTRNALLLIKQSAPSVHLEYIIVLQKFRTILISDKKKSLKITPSEIFKHTKF